VEVYGLDYSVMMESSGRQLFISQEGLCSKEVGNKFR
jgi:hypothetical protein